MFDDAVQRTWGRNEYVNFYGRFLVSVVLDTLLVEDLSQVPPNGLETWTDDILLVARNAAYSYVLSGYPCFVI